MFYFIILFIFSWSYVSAYLLSKKKNNNNNHSNVIVLRVASKSHNGTETEMPNLVLGICGICEFHQSWINRKLVSPEVRKKSFIQRCQEIMASLVEVRFIDESDFVNKGNGFILRDCSDWELDSTISLELTDLLDDISIF